MSLFQISNVSITTTTWTQLSGSQATQLLLRTRGGTNFKVSDTAAGTAYFTAAGALSIDFENSYENSTPCDIYVQATVNDTLEVLEAR